MTMTPSLRLTAAIGIACAISSAASAVTLTYDANTTAPANDGAGVWDTATANWYNGSTDQLWSNGLGDTAIFGAATAGTGGTVTVGTVNVGTIQFNPQTTTGYTLSTGTITLGGSAAITTSNTLGSTISAKISGSSGLNFTGVLNSGVGVTLSGANDYTGITTISTGGRLTTGSATALGSSVGASASSLGTNYTQINANATLGLTNSTSEAFLINGQGSVASGNPPGTIRFGAALTLSSLVQLGSNAQIASNGSGTVTIAGNLDLQGFTLGAGNGSLAFNANVPLNVTGVLTGTSAGILDVGAGGGNNFVNLTNNGNTFAGTTRVNASSGTSFVGLGGDTVLGNSTLVFNGGGVQSTNATARNIANTIGTFTGNALFGPSLTISPVQTAQTGTLNFTYNTALVSLGTTAKTFTTNVDTTFAAGFSNSAQLIKAGASTLFLTNTGSTRTGITTINAGILNVASLANGGANSAIGASTNVASNLAFGGGTLQYTGSTAQSTNRLFALNTGGGVIDASGSAPAATVSFTNTGTLDGGSGGSVRSLTLTGSNTGANSLASIVPDSATVTVSLAKSGAGTWALSGANTYSGGTGITAGTLLVNNTTGSGTGAGAVTVSNTGSVLGGSGTITTASGVTVNSGAAILGGTGAVASGALTLNNTSLTLSAGSIIELALGASGAHSTLAHTGTGSFTFDPTVGAGQKFTFIDLGAAPGIYEDIITGLGADPGNEGSWTITNAGFAGTFSYDGANIDLNLTAVPEPSTWLGGSLLVAGAAWSLRKRFRSLRAA